MSDYRTLLAEAMRVNAQALITVLAQWSISEVKVTYAGREGSGGVEELIVQPATTGADLTRVTLSYACVVGEYQGEDYRCETVYRVFTLEQALRDFTLTWAEFHHANWEVDEGSEGKVTIHTVNPRCQLRHTAFFLQHTNYCYAL